MVVMAGSRLRGRGFDSRIGTFFFHSFFLFFSVSFFPLSFSFMLAPPFQCSSIFLVVGIHGYKYKSANSKIEGQDTSFAQ